MVAFFSQSTTRLQERILRQRHSIRSIPVYEVNFMHRDSLSRFFVYGLDHKVGAHLLDKPPP